MAEALEAQVLDDEEGVVLDLENITDINVHLLGHLHEDIPIIKIE